MRFFRWILKHLYEQNGKHLDAEKGWMSFEMGIQSTKRKIGEMSELVSDACETALKKVGLKSEDSRWRQ